MESQRKTDREIVEEFRLIKKEYEWNPDVMCPDDDRVASVKKIIDTKLTLADKTIILLYADCQSYRKLAQRLGVSHQTIRKECIRIKNQILDEYDKLH